MNDCDVVIIGSGPAGLTAGIYCGRARLKTVIIERENMGGSIINSDLVENFPGFPQGIAGANLSGNMMSQAMAFGVTFEFNEVTSIDLMGGLKIVNTSSGQFRAKVVIIASGARYRKLGVPGEQELTGKAIFNCAMCDGGQFANKEVAVIGGGEGGVTEGLYLTRIASKVTMIEIMPKLNAPAMVQERAKANPKLQIMCSTQVMSIAESDGIRVLRLRNTQTGEESDLKVNGIFVIIGLEPAIEYLHGIVELDSAGFIKVDNAMRTSVPGIFAAGDIRSGSIWQAIAAAGDGAVAARSAEKYLSSLESG